MIIMAKSQHKNRSGKGNGKNQPPVQAKKAEKKKNNFWIPLLILVILIALAVWIMYHFNIGFFGKDDSDNSTTSQNSSSDSVSTDNDDSEKIIEISVSGNQYFYDNGKTEIADFINELKEMKGYVRVNITKDNAYSDSVQDLEDALTNAGIPFTVNPDDKD